jgi:DNA-binding response OmpR family regulator
MTRVFILQVEDDDEDAAFLGWAFRELQIEHELTCLADGESVLPFLNTTAFKPNLIILDVQLPKLNGLEVLRLIRASPHGHIPVVMLTSAMSERTRSEALDSGARKWLSKPFSASEYVRLVHEILDVVV